MDRELVELIELLNLHGVRTRRSCQDTPSGHGAWRDDPETKRFYVALHDVEDLRRLLPLLADSDELARSIQPSLDSPRWEYHLTPQLPWDRSHDPGSGVRLQVSIFMPVTQLDALVRTLQMSASHMDPVRPVI